MRLTVIPFLFLLSACAMQATTTAPANGAARYLALGDSYTIGESVAVEGRWPVQLARLLRERGVKVAPPEIIARTGWTTGELSSAIDAANPSGPYEMVTLLIGVNNQYRGRPLDEYRPEFRALLERAIGFAGGTPARVVVLSIPDWGVTPFAEGRDRETIAREIDAYNAAKREITLSSGAHWVDVTPVSRERGAEAEMLAADGLHPSAEMYREWALLALPSALEALRPR